MHLIEATCRGNGNFMVKFLVKFLVKIVGQTKQKQHYSLQQQRGSRERSARAPSLFPSGLLFPLFCVTRILSKNLPTHLTMKLTFFR